LTVAGDWAGTTLEVPAGSWKNWFTGHLVNGGSIGIEELLGGFPVALLVGA
jgi:maltooligosyltrehalose synthase